MRTVYDLSNDERNLSKGIAHWFFGLCVGVEKLESILWRIHMSVWYYDAVILLCDLDNDWSLVLLNLFWFSPRTSVICNKNAHFESYYSFDSRNFLALFRIVIVSFVDLSYAQLILRMWKKILVRDCSFCLSVWLMTDTNYLMYYWCSLGKVILDCRNFWHKFKKETFNITCLLTLGKIIMISTLNFKRTFENSHRKGRQKNAKF